MARQELLAGQAGGDNAVPVLEQAALGQAAQDGVSGRFFPGQRAFSQRHQLARGNRLIVPDEAGKPLLNRL